MADPKDVESAKRRTDTVGRVPVDGFSLEPLPEEIVRAFPKMKEWEARTNARIAEYVRKVNTVQQQV